MTHCLKWASIVFTLALMSCTPKPQEAPPSASSPIEATVAGLRALYKRECVEQQNLAWAREEARRRAARCKDFIFGDDDRCAAEIDGDLSWINRTTSGEQVKISLSWLRDFLWPRDRPAFCAIEIPSTLGSPIREAVQQIASEELNLREPTIHYTVGEDEVWVWSRTAPQIELVHIRSQRDRWWLQRSAPDDFLPEHSRSVGLIPAYVERDCPLNWRTATYECPYPQ